MAASILVNASGSADAIGSQTAKAETPETALPGTPTASARECACGCAPRGASGGPSSKSPRRFEIVARAGLNGSDADFTMGGSLAGSTPDTPNGGARAPRRSTLAPVGRRVDASIVLTVGEGHGSDRFYAFARRRSTAESIASR